MRVLGIAGSPRQGGNTDCLLAEVMRGAASRGAEIKTLRICQMNIAPCRHCDGCLAAGECTIEDDMQSIYKELAAADRIVLASPLYFMGVTAQLKAMIDRCQALWARKYILKLPPLGEQRQRKGLFISVGGRKAAGVFQPATATIKAFFVSLDIEYAGELLFAGMDDREAASSHPDALKQAYLAGQKLAV